MLQKKSCNMSIIRRKSAECSLNLMCNKHTTVASCLKPVLFKQALKIQQVIR